MSTFRLEFVSPAGLVAIEGLTFLNAPGREGRLTIEPGHEPLVCGLQAGALRWRLDSGEPGERSVAGGVMTVLRGVVAVIGR